MPRFTADDVGKTVVDPTGDEVGIVEAVEDGVPYVDPHPSLTDRVEAGLGWSGDPDISEYPLADEHVADVTDDEIRLREDLHTDLSG